MDAILEAWVQLDTIGIIETVNRIDAAAKTKLLRLFELAIGNLADRAERLAEARLQHSILTAPISI